MWGITEGDENARIEKAIAQTQAFFEKLGLSMHLGDYDLGEEAIEAVVGQLETHGMTALGEQQEITPAVSRRILQRSLSGSRID